MATSLVFSKAPMDPLAAPPPGHDLRIEALPAAEPVAALLTLATTAAAKASTVARALTDLVVKAGRGPKEKPPIGADVPEALLLNTPDDRSWTQLRARAWLRRPPSPAARPAAAAAVPAASPPAITAPGVRTFVGGTDTQTTNPPDTHGAVSPTHVLTTVNDLVYCHDRAGALQYQVSLDQFWQALLPGFALDTFDPRVLFDVVTGRFYFCAVANARRNDSCLLLAVSSGADPAAPWHALRLGVDPAQHQGLGQPVWLDFPSIGYSADKVTVTVNLYALDGSAFGGASVYAFEKAHLLAGTAVSSKRFDLFNKGGVLVPAVTRDAGMADQWLVNRWSGTQMALYQLRGSVAAGACTLHHLGMVASGGAAWAHGGVRGPQKGTATKLSTNDDRVLAAVWRHGELAFCHTIFTPHPSPTAALVQVWSVRPAAVGPFSTRVTQLRSAEDPAVPACEAFPSLDINARGDLLIGHAYFRASLHPSGAFSLLRGGIGGSLYRQVHARGLDVYDKTIDRWGDYSATQVDPINDTDFWTLQERAATRGAHAGVWQVVWAEIRP